MTNEKRAYDLFKNQYLKFVEKNNDIDTITRYLAEMNFVEKLEDIAINNNFTEEIEYLKNKKEIILQELQKKGISKKNK